MHVYHSKDKKVLHCAAHRIVFIHFKGQISNGLEINHNNGSRDDNRPKNLVAVTRSENQRHALRMKLGDNILTDKRVIEIRRLHAKGNYTYMKLAEMFKVSATTVSYIVRRKIWTHI